MGIVGMGYRPLDRAIWVALTLLVLGLCYLRQPCVIGQQEGQKAARKAVNNDGGALRFEQAAN